MHGRSAVCQADIRSYYDELPTLALCHFMVRIGIPTSLVAVCLRIQLLPVISLSFADVTVRLEKRTKGGLTGTRTAGALGRIPILDLIATREHTWRAKGFKLGSDPNTSSITMATYIDNLYAVSDGVEGAISIMSDAEQYLLSNWHLTLKPSSKLVTSAAVGSAYIAGDKVGEYLYEQDFPVLGHVMNNAGSIARSFETTTRKMWKAFWGNAGSKAAKTLGRQRLATLIVRSVQPLFEFQCARWPAQITYLNKLDTLQRKMIASAFGLCKSPAETMEQHNRRSCRISAPYIKTPWSHIWCRRMMTWRDHMARHPTLWPARISAVQDSEWLQVRRILCGSQSRFVGPTRTRATRGKVERRWQEGLEFGQAFLQQRT